MSSVGHDLDGPTGVGFDSAGDLVRIVSRLTEDIEQFDSMLSYEQHLLTEHGSDLRAFDDRRLRRQTKRIDVRAAEIATRVAGALEELRGLSLVGERVALDTAERQPGGKRSEDRPADHLPPMTPRHVSESSRRDRS